MHDLVIRSGTVVDGTGSGARTADIAVDGDVIVEVGRVVGSGAQEIDADGALVTPGFVDIHTHYDGQITWDPMLTPSCWHGVTTVVMGNCGVGFAPVRPESRDWLIGLMEGVEDIPGAALSAGIRWDWESFPEFLDAVDKVPKAVDVGTQVPHGAVRAFVMGDRGARNEPATAKDIEAMADIVREGMRGVPSGSRPRAPLPTGRSTESRYPERSRPRTSCSESDQSLVSSAPECSSSRPPVRSARIWLHLRRRCRGCAACRVPSAGP